MLYTVAHSKDSGFKVIRPVITKTSLPQQWHVASRTKGILSQPVTDLVVHNTKPDSKRQSAKTDLSSNENDMCKGQKRNCVKQKLCNPIKRPLNETNFGKIFLKFVWAPQLADF